MLLLDRTAGGHAPGATRLVYDQWLHGASGMERADPVDLPARFHFDPGACQAISLWPISPLELSCVVGVLWITREHDAVDYVLDAGQSIVVPAGESVYVQGIRSGVLHVQCAAGRLFR